MDKCKCAGCGIEMSEEDIKAFEQKQQEFVQGLLDCINNYVETVPLPKAMYHVLTILYLMIEDKNTSNDSAFEIISEMLLLIKKGQDEEQEKNDGI